MNIEFTKIDKKTYAYTAEFFENVEFVSMHGDEVVFKQNGEWHRKLNVADFDFMSVM